MERCKVRRLSFVDTVFGSPETLGERSVVRLANGEEPFRPSLPLALLGDEADDVLVVPGLLVAEPGTELAERLGGDDAYERVPIDDELGLVAFRRTGDQREGAFGALRSLGEASSSLRARVAAPVHGFVAHQKMKSSEDPELAPLVPAPRPAGRGKGSSIAVLDTGLASVWAWQGSSVRAADASDEDPLVGAIAGYLGRSAGHGTFVAALCHQVAPAAEITVRRVASTEGFVDELTLADRIGRIGRDDPAPDVLVLAFGGYSVKLGSFGTTGTGDTWGQPLLLKASLRALLRRCPELVVVASAGNNDSTDPCYPAAFAVEAEFAGRVVSVGALDAEGYRWPYSNYGRWVTASTLGVRLWAPYVEGLEHPSNEPDGSPERFPPLGCASWSGTSFSTALVAGRLVELQAALRNELGRPVPATEAWQVLQASSKPQREGRCGVHVQVDGVAHG